jgi:sugar diacid utilization regulator
LSLLYHGAFLHSLEGSTHVNVLKANIDIQNKQCFMESIWSNSYEAEQHCRHFSLSDEPVCWTLTGYASGYTSAIFGHRVLFREIKCVGMGDEFCQVVCKPVEEWGAEIEGELDYFSESKISEELEDAHRRIKKQNQFLKQVMRIHNQLNRLILEGGNIQDIVKTVGKTLGNSIVAEDRFMRTLAAWIEPEKDISPFLLSSTVSTSNLTRKKLDILKKEKRTIDIVSQDEPLLPRTVSPILIGSDVSGYLSIIHTSGIDIELIHLIAERVAEVIGFILLQERMILETEIRFKGEFIDELLQGNISDDVIQHRAQRFGYNFLTPHRFLLVQVDRNQSKKKDGAQNDNKLFDFILKIVSSIDKRYVVVKRAEVIIIFIDEKIDPFELSKKIHRQFHKEFYTLSFSICLGRESSDVSQLRESYKECRAVMELQQRLGKKNYILSVEEMGSFGLLLSSLGSEYLRSYVNRILEPLLQYNSLQEGELLRTLYWYLCYEGNIRKTAEALQISVGGLKHRLERIRNVSHIQLDNPEIRFDLQLALRFLIADGTLKLSGLNSNSK